MNQVLVKKSSMPSMCTPIRPTNLPASALPSRTTSSFEIIQHSASAFEHHHPVSFPNPDDTMITNRKDEKYSTHINCPSDFSNTPLELIYNIPKADYKNTPQNNTSNTCTRTVIFHQHTTMTTRKNVFLLPMVGTKTETNMSDAATGTPRTSLNVPTIILIMQVLQYNIAIQALPWIQKEYQAYTYTYDTHHFLKNYEIDCNSYSH